MVEVRNSATWTASELLTSVYRACRLPDSGSIDYPPSVVLTMADEAIHNWAGHLLASARDGRAVTHVALSIENEQDDASGQTFRLPPMALANTIESVKWTEEESDTDARSLQLIPAGMEGIFSNWTERGSPTSYALFNETLKVYPVPEERGYLRITYMRRHGQLVIGSDMSTVVSVEESVTPNWVLINLTSGPSSFVTNAWVDVYSSYYPYPLKFSGRLANYGPSAIYVYGDYTETAAVVVAGDTVVLYGKTPYISLPLEMKGPLVQQIAQQITAELGDFELSTGYNNLSKEGAARVADMLSPRAKSDKQKLVNHNSLARGGYRRRFWGGRGA